MVLILLIVGAVAVWRLVLTVYMPLYTDEQMDEFVRAAFEAIQKESNADDEAADLQAHVRDQPYGRWRRAREAVLAKLVHDGWAVARVQPDGAVW